ALVAADLVGAALVAADLVGAALVAADLVTVGDVAALAGTTAGEAAFTLARSVSGGGASERPVSAERLVSDVRVLTVLVTLFLVGRRTPGGVLDVSLLPVP
ncbi:MAG: hypothetical protein ACP5P9_04035, partial [Acidimicrobiales bacterium]